MDNTSRAVVPPPKRQLVRFKDLPSATRAVLLKELVSMKDACDRVDRLTTRLIHPNGKKSPTADEVCAALDAAVPLYEMVRTQVPTAQLSAGDERDLEMVLLTKLVSLTVSFVMAASTIFGNEVQPYFNRVAGINQTVSK